MRGNRIFPSLERTRWPSPISSYPQVDKVSCDQSLLSLLNQVGSGRAVKVSSRPTAQFLSQRRATKSARIQSSGKLRFASEPKSRSSPHPPDVWNNLDPLPASRLMQIVPAKELELDDQYILGQRAKYERNQQEKSVRKREMRDDGRAALMRRHKEVEELEKRTGVIKVRNIQNPPSKVSFDGSFSSSFLGSFGLAKSYYFTSPRLREISRPKEVFKPKDPLLYSEFKGLIQKENPEAVNKLRTCFSVERCASGGIMSRQRRVQTPMTPSFN